MVTIEWAMLCKTFRLDENELPCIEGIFSSFVAPDLPFEGTGTLVVRLRGEHGESAIVTVELREPGGAVAAVGTPSDATVTIGEQGLQDLSVRIRLPFQNVGRYELRVSANDQERCLPLTVELSKPPVVH